MRKLCGKVGECRRAVEKLCGREILVPRLLGGLKMDLAR